MISIKQLTLIFGTAFITAGAQAQDNSSSEQTNTTRQITQNVRGRVLDAASQQPLTGVIVLLASDNSINTTTDENGNFILRNVPLGRQSFAFTYLGFETYIASEVPVISGKQAELNISLNESLKQLDEVNRTAVKDKITPLNEFAAVSARSFSVEETRRYAASIADPARMVMNFPGVSNSGDMDNSIVVRGNSPSGVLWRLEGIEISNPNHFSSSGATGGSVSMLNANTLGNSDFYTGAFAPEIGNALAGVFDINFRNGNTERHEHTIQIGTMGAEIATEGPLKKGRNASYLFNYRYSTLALLERFIKIGGDAMPNYQDAALKINLPTQKAGTFSIFGLGGYNELVQKAEKDSTKWGPDNPNRDINNNNTTGIAGLSHQYFFNRNAYIKTIVSVSHTKSLQENDSLHAATGYSKTPMEQTDVTNNAYRASILYNHKLNSKFTFRAGAIASQVAYRFTAQNYNGQENTWKSVLASDGATQFYQAYVQLRTRMTERLTMVGGAHASYLAHNGKYSIEPRASLAYQMNDSKATLAAGLHSKPEHISTYMYKNSYDSTSSKFPNKNLDLSRAFHAVAGYDVTVLKKVRIKAEAYYQKLYSMPVEKDTASGFSMINSENIYSLMALKSPLVSEGTGENYGIDMSIEKPFFNGYYILAAVSVFTSTYTNYKGERYNTRYNRGHQLNLIGGKEFRINKKGKNILGVNGKLLYSGGMRESLIDLNASIAKQETVIVDSKYFTEKTPAYFRADLSLYYKMNGKSATHTIQMDVQNVTNRENHYFSYFDGMNKSIRSVTQLGIIPTISYRVDFHW